ncbi:MAG: SOS cell division inhibitor, partial [Azonexus sp.]
MRPAPSPVVLAEVLARGDVWRGDTLASLPAATIPSGHAELDAELPGGGWPCGNLTEILVDRSGLGEMTLLLPALARLSQAGGWLALVAPPWR